MYDQNELKEASDLLFLIKKNKIDKALSKSLELNLLFPENSLINNFLGSHYLNIGNLNIAKKYLTKAYKKNFNNLDINYNMAVISKKELKYSEAEFYLKKCIDLSDDDEYRLLLSKLYFESLKFFKKSIQILLNFLKKKTKFQNKFVYHLLALNYEYDFQFEEAKKFHDKLLALAEDQDEKINFSILQVKYFRKIGDYESAEKIINYLKKKYPNNFEIFLTSGIFYRFINNYDQSKKDLQRSIEIKNKKESFLNRSKFNYGCTLIANKEYKLGWKYYACREYNHIESNFKKKISTIKKLVNNQDLKIHDKLLIWSDQGYGDNIFFFRFLSNIKKDNIFFVSKNNDYSFFDKNNIGVKVIKHKEFMSDVFKFDYQINISCLPSVFDIELPSRDEIFNFNNNDVKFKYLLNNNKKLNIGITWSGNPEYKQDYSRSILFDDFKKIISSDNFNYYCLQKEIQPRDKKSFELSNVKYVGDLNFYDLSLFTKNLDLVITTDTSIVHLCGSLNIDTILLLSKFPDWRWIQTEQIGKTVWYNSVKFFKQKTFGDWSSVFELVKIELENIKNNS